MLQLSHPPCCGLHHQLGNRRHQSYHLLCQSKEISGTPSFISCPEYGFALLYLFKTNTCLFLFNTASNNTLYCLPMSLSRKMQNYKQMIYVPGCYLPLEEFSPGVFEHRKSSGADASHSNFKCEYTNDKF